MTKLLVSEARRHFVLSFTFVILSSFFKLVSFKEEIRVASFS